MSITDDYNKAVERLRSARVDPFAFAALMQAQQNRRIALLVGALASGAIAAALDDHDPGDEDRS